MAAQLVSSSTLQVASAALRSPFAMVDSLAAVAAMAEGRGQGSSYYRYPFRSHSHRLLEKGIIATFFQEGGVSVTQSDPF